MMANREQENLLWVQQVLQIRTISIWDLRDGSLLLEILNKFGHLPHGEKYYSRPANDKQTYDNLFLIKSIMIKYNWLKNSGPLMDQLFGNYQSYFFVLDVIRYNVTQIQDQLYKRQDLINRVTNILVEDRNPYLKLENLYHLFNLNRHKLVHQDSRYLGRINQDQRGIYEPFENSFEHQFAKTFGQVFAKQFGQKFGEQFGQNFATTFGQNFGANFGHEIAPFLQQQVILQQKMEQIIINQDIKNQRKQKSDEEIQKNTNGLTDNSITTCNTLTLDSKTSKIEEKQYGQEQKHQDENLIYNPLANLFQQKLVLNSQVNDEDQTKAVQNQKKEIQDADDC